MNSETEQIFLLNPATSQSSEPISRTPPSQVNLENVNDFSHVCRTCATITEFVMPIYAGEGLQNNLADKIRKHLPIQVSESDELPLVVCFQCASTLLAFHELVKCCEQADAALHAKLRSNKRKLNGTLNMKEEDPKTKAAYRSCVYCRAWLAGAAYRQHLVLQHGDLLFLCEVCDRFVDRRELIVHMSYHATHADVDERLHDLMRRRREPTAPASPPAPAAPPPPHEPETKPLVKIEPRKTSAPKIKTIVQVNEFSDHSDTDDFGPLPESVFEAIEDTQDSQHLEDNNNQTLDCERLNDESNKSSTPENDSSSPAQSSENNNNFTNNCSVVIEPIDINSCAQSMNIVIKNTSSDTSGSPVPQDTKTPPEAADNGSSELGKRNRNKLRKCPHCPKEYRASSSYFYHVKYTHRSSREHECDVCGRKFGTRACLTQHAAVHSAHYGFQCEQCQKQFKSKAGLYIHSQTHGGARAWSCAQCGAAFRWRAQLQRHAARHAGVRAHACTHAACGRAFSVRADLLRHARTHAAGCHACDKCGQKFAQLRYLKAHTTKLHKTNVKKPK